MTNSSPANDYAAANLGQLKQMASQAAVELDAHLPGGAGTAITDLITIWQQPPAAGITRNDYAVLNVGQLKAVAKPFYDRLIQVGYTTAYPWTTSTADDNNYAAANLGQLKQVFSFDLTSTDAAHDTDQDGMPDWWETYYNNLTGDSFFNPNNSDGNGNGILDGAEDTNSDGVTNSEEALAGSNPTNTDSDGDGVLNVDDLYPTDNRRSEDIPAQNYAVIDLGEGTIPAATEFDQIAMGQDGRVAFSWWDGSSYQVAKWKNGVMEPQSPKPTGSQLKIYRNGVGSNPTTINIGVPTSNAFLNSNGTLVREGWEGPDNPPEELDLMLAFWPYGESSATDKLRSLPSSDPNSSNIFETGQFLLENGTFMGESDYSSDTAGSLVGGIGKATLADTGISMILKMEAPPAGYEWSHGYIFPYSHSSSGKMGVLKAGDLRATETGNPTKYVQESMVVNSDGTSTRIKRFDGDALPTTVEKVGEINVINDSGDFVLSDSGEGKSLYYKAGVKVGPLKTLLPALYDQQTRYGAATATAEATMSSLSNSGQLLFSMENLEGPGQGTWNKRTFLSDKIIDPANSASNQRSLKVAQFPDNYDVTLQDGAQGITDSGLLAATIKKTKNPDNSPIPAADQKKKPGLLVPFNLIPNPIPLNGVVRAKIAIGIDSEDIPALPEGQMPVIKIGTQVCTKIRQDEYDHRVFYFTPPSSPTEAVGSFDLEVSGITVNDVPCLSNGTPLVLKNFATYTNDAEKGVKKFSEAIGVSISEAESMAKKKKADNGLSAEEEANFYSYQLDSQASEAMVLMKTFMDGKNFTQQVTDALASMENVNSQKTSRILTGFGINPTGGGGSGGSGTGGGVFVKIVATDDQASETGDTGTVVFTRSGNFNSPMTINFTIMGTATNGGDYATIANSITIPAHEASKALIISPLSDAISEGNETVQIILPDNPPYQIEGSNTAQVIIHE